MKTKLTGWQHRLQQYYGRKEPMVLLNGLAEQAETWFLNHRYWRRHFDVYMPNLLAYEGTALQARIAKDLPITIDYLVEQLKQYLDLFVQTPPYHLVASSLGGKIAIDFAARFPDQVARLVLLCPSGLGEEEQLPLVEGVRRNDVGGLVRSVFHDPKHVEPGLLAYYQRQFAKRRWRLGLLRTIRGTMDHCVRDRLAQVVQPTLLVAGREDRIVSPTHAEMAACDLPQGQFLMIPQCGHAPHIEKPGLINRLVVHFFTQAQASSPSSLATVGRSA